MGLRIILRVIWREEGQGEWENKGMKWFKERFALKARALIIDEIKNSTFNFQRKIGHKQKQPTKSRQNAKSNQ